MDDINLKTCTICLEDILTDIEFLPCAHSFHRDCISGWVVSKPTCPMCKIPIYVNSPDQLNLYNYHKNIQDQNAERESRFFHQVSAGVFDNADESLGEDYDNQLQIPNILNDVPHNIRFTPDELNEMIANVVDFINQLPNEPGIAIEVDRPIPNNLQPVAVTAISPTQRINLNEPEAGSLVDHIYSLPE